MASVLLENFTTSILNEYSSYKTMDLCSWTNSVCCGAMALLFIIIVLSTKSSRARILTHQGRPSRLPPAVNGFALLALVPSLLKKGLPAVLNDLYVKYGSVFMVSPFGQKLTFLIGPEVTAHFFQGSESEVSYGNLLEFFLPMFGKSTGYAVDSATRLEQSRFHFDAIKQSKLSSHVSPMLQEVESYFAKWENEGIVDLKIEFDQLLMLICSRCLLGKEVRENMFDEINTPFSDIGKGFNFISFLYPYLPTPTNWQRDRAHIRLIQIISDLVESRKRSGRVEEDTLQRLIDSKYKDGRSTTLAEVAELSITLLFAGKHSSSISSTWTGACLLSHPAFLRAATVEQEQITKKYKDGLEYNAFSEMETLHNCIKEALRMHPPGLMLLRKVHKQFMVLTKQGKQYEIPQDHIIVSPTVVSNSIPYIYKDPLIYDPDRFGPERREDKVGDKFSYTSFGGGRHACIGEAYAFMQIKVIWSHLLRNFEFELISPFPKTNWGSYAAEPGDLVVRYKRTGFVQLLK